MTGSSPQTDGKRVENNPARPFADLGGLPSDNAARSGPRRIGNGALGGQRRQDGSLDASDICGRGNRHLNGVLPLSTMTFTSGAISRSASSSVVRAAMSSAVSTCLMTMIRPFVRNNLSRTNRVLDSNEVSTGKDMLHAGNYHPNVKTRLNYSLQYLEVTYNGLV